MVPFALVQRKGCNHNYLPTSPHIVHHPQNRDELHQRHVAIDVEKDVAGVGRCAFVHFPIFHVYQDVAAVGRCALVNLPVAHGYHNVAGVGGSALVHLAVADGVDDVAGVWRCAAVNLVAADGAEHVARVGRTFAVHLAVAQGADDVAAVWRCAFVYVLRPRRCSQHQEQQANDGSLHFVQFIGCKYRHFLSSNATQTLLLTIFCFERSRSAARL